ncbi:MAG: hypothetical protein ABGY41_11195, partial [Candidatus Poribacteria bacterium]
MSRLLVRLCVGVALAVAVSRSAFAVVGLTPLQLDVYARPGIPEEFTLTVSNTTQTQRTVRLVVADVRIDENGETQVVEDPVDEPASGGFDDASGDEPGPVRVSARSVVSFEDGGILVLQPGEEREVTCSATLPPGETTEHLAFVMVDPGPEEMPVYNNSRMRIEVTFRIAARVLIIPGVRRVRRDADGNSRVTLERIIRPTYFVEFEDTQAVIPAKDAADSVLRVEGVLSNRSNTYITPLIQAQLRNLTTRRIVEKVTLSHGLAFVMGSTTRRFSGAFTSALEPGQYEITVEVDLGDSSPPRRTQLALELTAPLVGRSQGPQGVVSLDTSKATVRLRPGERSAGRVQVTNNFGET